MVCMNSMTDTVIGLDCQRRSLINFINDYVRELYNCMNINPCKKSKLDTFVAVLLCFWVFWGGLGCFWVVWGVLGWFGVFPRTRP